MTIKQIFLLTSVAIATQMHGSQGPNKPTAYATRTPQKPAQSAKRTPQQSTSLQQTASQQPTVTIINGPFINYGTAYIGTANRAPHGMPAPQQQKTLANMGNNQFCQVIRSTEAQGKYVAMQHMARQQTAQLQTPQQQEFLRNKAEEDKKMIESQKAAYAQLQELSAVSDLLPKKQANQLNSLMKCRKEESYVLAEDILNRLNKTEEVQDIKPFIGLLKYADTLEFSTPPTPKTTDNPISRPIVPKKFPLKLGVTPATNKQKQSSTPCIQLDLAGTQYDAWNKILKS